MVAGGAVADAHRVIAGELDERRAGGVIDRLLATGRLWHLRPGALPEHVLLAVRCHAALHAEAAADAETGAAADAAADVETETGADADAEVAADVDTDTEVGAARNSPGDVARSWAVAEAVIALLERAHTQDVHVLDQTVTRAIAGVLVTAFARLGPRWAGRERYVDWHLTCGQHLPIGTNNWSRELGSETVVLAERLYLALQPQDDTTRAALQWQAVHGRRSELCQAAVQAVVAGWGEDPEMLPWLRDLATGSGRGPSVAQQLAENLPTPGPAEQAAWSSWLRVDPSAGTRWAALQAILAGWPDAPGIEPLLREIAVRDSCGWVRAVAVKACSGHHQGSRIFLDRWLRKRCADSWKHADFMVRVAAIEALAAGWAGDATALSLLHELAGTDGYSVRRAAVQAIATGWPDDRRTLPLLRDLAATVSGAEIVAELAAHGPGILGDPAATSRGSSVAARAAAGGTKAWRDRAVSGEGPVAAREPEVAAGLVSDPRTLAVLRDIAVRGREPKVVGALASRWADDPGTLPLLHQLTDARFVWTMRAAAVTAVAAGWPDDPRVLPLLREIATSDTYGLTRVAAVRAIAAGWPEDPRTLPLLREIATTTTDYLVRHGVVAVLAAGWFDDPDTAALLGDHAGTDHDIGPRGPADPVGAYNEDVRPVYWGAFDLFGFRDPEVGVRVIGIRWLAARRDRDLGTLALLRRVATADPDPTVRLAAVRAIAVGWAGVPGTASFLRERGVADRKREIRAACVQAVVARWPDDPETLPFLYARAEADDAMEPQWAATDGIASARADVPGIRPFRNARVGGERDMPRRRQTGSP
jgi:hypothetical protein